MANLLQDVRTAVSRVLLRLPLSWISVLTGPSRTVDGFLLDTRTQWLLKLIERTGRPPLQELPVPEARAEYAMSMHVLGGRRQPIGEGEVDAPHQMGILRNQLAYALAQVHIGDGCSQQAFEAQAPERSQIRSDLSQRCALPRGGIGDRRRRLSEQSPDHVPDQGRVRRIRTELRGRRASQRREKDIGRHERVIVRELHEHLLGARPQPLRPSARSEAVVIRAPARVGVEQQRQ